MSLFRARVCLGVFGHEDVEVLAEACVCHHDLALAKVRAWHDAGAELEDIYLGGLAPAARLLGEWWLSDRMDFVKVTIGVHSLQQILYEFSPLFLQRANQKFNGLRAIFFSAPGSQHSFGSIMVAEFFRREGWKVSSVAPDEEADVFEDLSKQWVDVVGFSASCYTSMQVLKSVIPRARQVSLNPNTHIMVGGPMVELRPDLAVMLGADSIGGDAVSAQRLARQSVKKLELAA